MLSSIGVEGSPSGLGTITLTIEFGSGGAVNALVLELEGTYLPFLLVKSGRVKNLDFKASKRRVKDARIIVGRLKLEGSWIVGSQYHVKKFNKK